MLKKLIFIVPLLIAATGVVAIYVVKDSTLDNTSFATTSFSPSYITFAEYSSDTSQYQDKRILYFFHAVWCPTCRALENDIKKNIGSLPSDVIIVKTNFDTEQDLKQKFGVVVQHTIVQINSNDEILGKWIAQPSLSSVLEDLQV